MMHGGQIEQFAVKQTVTDLAIEDNLQKTQIH